MTAPVTDVLATDLPSLDAAVACEYGTDCPCAEDHSCAEPAVWRARMHGLRRPDDATCGNHTMLLCNDHLAEWRDGIERLLATAGLCGARCGCCGKPLNHISDILLEVAAL